MTDSQRLSAQLLHHRREPIRFCPPATCRGRSSDYNWRQQNSNLTYTWIDYAHPGQPDLAQLHAILRRTHQPARASRSTTSVPITRFKARRTCRRSRSPATSRSASPSPDPWRATTSTACATWSAITRGRHSLRFGGDISLSKDIQQTLLNNYGVFSFTSSQDRPQDQPGRRLRRLPARPPGHHEPGRARNRAL